MKLVVKDVKNVQSEEIQSMEYGPHVPSAGASFATRNGAAFGMEDEAHNEEEELNECGCGCPMCTSGEHHPNQDLEYHYHDDDFNDELPIEILPSNTKLVITVIDEGKKKKKKGDRCVRIARRKYHKWPSAYASGAVVKCRQGKIWKGLKETIEEELSALVEEGEIKDKSLHDWFGHRQGGWVNCRTGGPCGRPKAGRGAKGKYPACRPTMSQCKSGSVRRKKGPKTVSWKDQRKKEE